MLGIIKTVSVLFKLKPIQIHSRIFDLNGRLTVILLVICSCLLTLHQIVDEQIICQAKEEIPGDMLNKYCWLISTHAIIRKTPWDITYVEQHYYKYSTIVLLISAALFYLPRFVWKRMEGQRCSFLVNKLNNPKLDKSEKDAQIDSLVEYFRDNLGQHRSYSFKYLFCELWCFLNVVAQLTVMLHLLRNEMRKYNLDAVDWIIFDPQAMMNTMETIFPKLTGCNFFKFGSTGTLELKATNCLLTMNVINEKIYFLLFVSCSSYSTSLTSPELLLLFFVSSKINYI